MPIMKDDFIKSFIAQWWIDHKDSWFVITQSLIPLLCISHYCQVYTSQVAGVNVEAGSDIPTALGYKRSSQAFVVIQAGHIRRRGVTIMFAFIGGMASSIPLSILIVDHSSVCRLRDFCTSRRIKIFSPRSFHG